MPQHAERTRILRRNGFTFKQFFVAHDRCAMKVGTDSVLLGAWAPIPATGSVLDIGCGSGVIALMLAQRTSAAIEIDAVELDPEAAEQAQENSAASPWASRIQVFTADIANFSPTLSTGYALIVCNPPYFVPGMACRSAQRASARYTTHLPHDVLLGCARKLLAPGGYFCLVLPSQVAEGVVALAQQGGWVVRQRLDVSETVGREPHRVLLALSDRAGECYTQTLTLRSAEGSYSPDFCALTQNFYLFM